MNNAGHNTFLRLFAALMLVAILPVTGQAIAQSNRTQLLTPKGTLRAALIIYDSVLVTRNPQGELGGILVEIANALATSLNTPLHMVPYYNIVRYNQSIGKDEWDIALAPRDLSRVDRVAFSQTFLEVENGFQAAKPPPSVANFTTPQVIFKKDLVVAAERNVSRRERVAHKSIDHTS
jgi:hypothetical protein